MRTLNIFPGQSCLYVVSNRIISFSISWHHSVSQDTRKRIAIAQQVHAILQCVTFFIYKRLRRPLGYTLLGQRSLTILAMVETDSSGRRVYPLYKYPPSMAAAVIFCILFCITTLLHSYQMFRRRHWFLIPLVLGGYCKI